MKILKNFVVFEGIDGSGTTTQLNRLENFFLTNREVKRFPPFYKTSEPTNSSIGHLIRAGLRKETVLKEETIALLFAADRNEHLYGPNGIAERCGREELVVCDRYFPSSLVYQGITCGDALPDLLNRDFPGPELLLFFDIDPIEAQDRIAHRELKEIYEYLDFQIQVRQRYKELFPRLEKEGVKVETINASLPPDKVALEVWNHVEKMPIFNR